jgi:hypothetical protein
MSATISTPPGHQPAHSTPSHPVLSPIPSHPTPSISLTCRYVIARDLARAKAVQLGKSKDEVKRADVDSEPYTFMPWEQECLDNLSAGRSADFPFRLSHRGGLTKRTVALMRPLFNFGVKPEQLAHVILEMHTMAHCDASLAYEHELTIKRQHVNFPTGATLEMFSSFANRAMYAGCVPSGGYLARMYQDFHEVSNSCARMANAFRVTSK